MKKNVTIHHHIINSPSCWSHVEARLAPGVAVIEMDAFGDHDKPETFSVDSKKVMDWFCDLVNDYKAAGRKVFLRRGAREFMGLPGEWIESEAPQD